MPINITRIAYNICVAFLYFHLSIVAEEDDGFGDFIQGPSQANKANSVEDSAQHQPKVSEPAPPQPQKKGKNI